MFATMLRIHLWYSVMYLANVRRVSCEYTAEYFVDIPSRCIGSMQLNVLLVRSLVSQSSALQELSMKEEARLFF